MKLEQLYTNCLAQGAYYIESAGEAAIIDPLRETEPYELLAKENGSKIKYIFETHFHADFVSGHVTLAEKTGATIIYGPNAQTDFDAHIAVDGEEFRLGNLTIRVMHTPGHTMESTTYLLIDENGKDHAIFTGDTLFIGDVGRPDLAVKTDLTREDLASHLYDSLRNKIMPLSDDLIVYPAHGAGSACGKNMSKETWDTLGNQKKTNYALQDISREEFIRQVTDGIMEAPQYFAKNAMLNKTGYEDIDLVMERGKHALDPEAFEAAMEETGAIVLDVRFPQDFQEGHIPGSVNIGLNGMFAVWVGTLIEDLKQPILIVAPEDREEETIKRLARVGYDNVHGYLAGGINTWKVDGKPVKIVESITAEELEAKMKAGKVNILDVRKPSEFQAEHVEDAKNFPLDFITNHIHDLDKSQTWYVHCKSGYRSMVASSILMKNGYEHIVDVEGGFMAIEKTGISKTDYVCPTTLKNN